MSKQIAIQDKNGKINTWTIDHEDDITYSVSCGCHETLVYKDKCVEFNGGLYYTKDITMQDEDDSHYYDFDNISCYVCGKDIFSRARVVVDEYDNYVCVRCAKTHKLDYSRIG